MAPSVILTPCEIMGLECGAIVKILKRRFSMENTKCLSPAGVRVSRTPRERGGKYLYEPRPWLYWITPWWERAVIQHTCNTTVLLAATGLSFSWAGGIVVKAEAQSLRPADRSSVRQRAASRRPDVLLSMCARDTCQPVEHHWSGEKMTGARGPARRLQRQLAQPPSCCAQQLQLQNLRADV